MAEKPTYEELEQEIQKLKKTELECRDVEQDLQHQSQMHKTLMNIAACGINIPLDKANDAFQAMLGEMGKFVSVDRAYLFRFF